MVDATPVSGRLRDRIIGQEGALDRFSRAREQGRLAHAYLLVGHPGSGRTRLGLALAQELLCTGGKPPCGNCPGCVKTAQLIHPDLHLVLPFSRDELDNPEEMRRILDRYAGDPRALLVSGGTIGIDRIRELKEEVAKATVEAAWRVVLLAGAERLTEQAAQAALKLVEEPPPQTLLILTAADPARLLPTLVSRCQRVSVRPLGREILQHVLIDEREVPEAEAHLLAALSGGSLGRALEIREAGILDLRDRILEVFDLDPAGAHGARELERRVQSLEKGWNAEMARRGAELLLIWYRDLVAAAAGLPDEGLAHADRAAAARRESARLRPGEIARRVRIVEEMVQAVNQNVNPALALHAALGRIASGAEVGDLLD